MESQFVILKSLVFDDVTLDASGNAISDTPYTPTLKNGTFDKWVHFGVSGPLGDHTVVLNVEAPDAVGPKFDISADLAIQSDPRATILLRVIIEDASIGTYRFTLTIDGDQLGSIEIDL